MLLYPVYALLFADAGLSVAAISSLFAIWSLTGLVLELPSGVWADAVSRRALLVLAPLLAGAGFALWVAVGGYWAFAAGFVLWGAHGALKSGALEALVYETLDARGEADDYATVMGRATAAGTVGTTAATALAVPALAVGGFAWLGVASVAVCAASALVATTLHDPRTRPPRARPAHHGHHTGHASRWGWSRSRPHTEPNLDHLAAASQPRDGSPRAILTDALAEVRRAPAVRRALLLVPLVTAVWGALDEYLPLLADAAGAQLAVVPLIALVIYAAQAAGGLLAGRVEAGGPRRLAVVLVLAAALLAVGALSRELAGFAAIAAAFALFEAATVTADARLQHAIEGGARSTLTSFAAFATEVVVLATYALYGLGSLVLDDAVLFALFAVVYLPGALVARRR